LQALQTLSGSLLRKIPHKHEVNCSDLTSYESD